MCPQRLFPFPALTHFALSGLSPRYRFHLLSSEFGLGVQWLGEATSGVDECIRQDGTDSGGL